MGVTHHFEGVFVDEGGDVGGTFADDLLNQGSDDRVHLRLKVLANFLSFRFFHLIILRNHLSNRISRNGQYYMPLLRYSKNKYTPTSAPKTTVLRQSAGNIMCSYRFGLEP